MQPPPPRPFSPILLRGIHWAYKIRSKPPPRKGWDSAGRGMQPLPHLETHFPAYYPPIIWITTKRMSRGDTDTPFPPDTCYLPISQEGRARLRLTAFAGDSINPGLSTLNKTKYSWQVMPVFHLRRGDQLPFMLNEYTFNMYVHLERSITQITAL